MHKDQKRVIADILPVIEAAAGSTDPQDIRDCILLNRVFNQGPDPLLIMEVCPEHFAGLCLRLGLTVEQGKEAIEAAHWQGPAVLLDGGTGIPSLSYIEVQDRQGYFKEVAWRKEALWVLMASVSNCTEGGYEADVSLQERMQIVVKAGFALARLLDVEDSSDRLIKRALAELKEFESTVTFTKDARYPDVPHSDQDHAFYVGYRQGYSCVSVQSGTSTFYGTPPEHSLAEQGITVDKEISSQFGIVFGA